jgi:hypothetical protein
MQIFRVDICYIHALHESIHAIKLIAVPTKSRVNTVVQHELDGPSEVTDREQMKNIATIISCVRAVCACSV